MTPEMSQWHPVAYYLQKMILTETHYKMHDAKLLAIIKAFKSWYQYLEGCQYEVLVLSNHNNLCRFIDTKSLSSRQVGQAQKLYRYYFHIDYCQGKANKATDALSSYSQRSQGEEEILEAENTRIFQCLQSLLTNARVFSTPSTHVASLKYVIICETHALPDLCQSWEMFCQELAAKSPYEASIGGMRLRLVELQAEDGQVRKIRAEKLSGN